MKKLGRLLYSALAGLRSPGFEGPVRFDPATGEFLDSAIYRGFPLGGIGSGGLCARSEGGFGELRINNNWMQPIRYAKGSFFALGWRPDGGAWQARILRRSLPRGEEYEGIRPVTHCRFRGRIPGFAWTTECGPLRIELRGFSPLIPHALRDSTLPVASFELQVENAGDTPVELRSFFSMENLLGVGGTGETGLRFRRGIVAGLRGRRRYRDRRGNAQRRIALEPELAGLELFTSQQAPPDDHRRSVLGRYLLLAAPNDAFTLECVENWDAAEAAPAWLTALSGGEVLPTSPPGAAAARPAGAVGLRGSLAPGAQRTLRYHFVWWTAEHVVEPDPVRRPGGGRAVGHYYTQHFDDAEALARYVHTEQPRLRSESEAFPELLAQTTLPFWLREAVVNSADSLLSNSVLPRSGVLHTIEGVDWPWFFGGLTGTMDQRLSAHPYAAALFTELDRREVDSFRCLHQDGAIPHGNGNCDLGLEDADVPYGRPARMSPRMEPDVWPDLTLSTVLQIHRLYRMTGDEAWMDRCWPDLLRMADHLDGECRAGIPEGGSTYDTFEFPGTFVYTALLYLSALDALIGLAATRDPARRAVLEERRARAAARVDSVLWHPSAGIYRTSESRDSVFMGAMAGPWMARRSGLPDPVPSARIDGHLRHAHALLFGPQAQRRGHGAFPDTEVALDGRPVVRRIAGIQVCAYAWQVLSYHAQACIQAGLVAEGLAVIERLYRRMWEGGYPWSADLYGNAGPIYMTHPVLFATLEALSGVTLNRPEGQLRFKPQRLPGQAGTQTLPVCMPGFFGLLDVAEDGSARLRVTRNFGEPIEVQLGRLEAGAELEVPVRD